MQLIKYTFRVIYRLVITPFVLGLCLFRWLQAVQADRELWIAVIDKQPKPPATKGGSPTLSMDGMRQALDGNR